MLACIDSILLIFERVVLNEFGACFFPYAVWAVASWTFGDKVGCNVIVVFNVVWARIGVVFSGADSTFDSGLAIVSEVFETVALRTFFRYFVCFEYRSALIGADDVSDVVSKGWDVEVS